MAQITTSTGRRIKSKVRRKGIHAKSRSSRVKGSKVYKKAYRGQGK